MGNLGQTAFQTAATPVQNNSSMYAVIYTYTKGSWIVQPYFQYTDVPTNRGYRRREGSVDARRRDPGEPQLQTRLLARRALGIHFEHGESQPSKRSICSTVPAARPGRPL